MGPRKESSKPTEYDEVMDYVYMNVWPSLKTCIAEGVCRFMGERSTGIYASFKKGANGWDNIKSLATEIAEKKEYSVLTGRGIFKKRGGIVIFFPFLYHLAPILLPVEKYHRWLVSLCPKSIVLLGRIRATAGPEEEESLESGKPTCGIAVIKPTSDSRDCMHLQVLRSQGGVFSVCKGRIAACPQERGKYCPFFEIGVPYGRLDLYTRKKKGMLLATKSRQGIYPALTYLGFI